MAKQDMFNAYYIYSVLCTPLSHHPLIFLLAQNESPNLLLSTNSWSKYEAFLSIKPTLFLL